MRRREFITLLGGAAAIWPAMALAQQRERVRRLGVMMGYAQDDPEAKARVAAFLDGLKQTGWTDGSNVEIFYRWGGANPARYEMMVRELIALKPDVILSNTTPVTAALHRLTDSVPIVFVIVSDPVGDGLVKSLSRPGGNITGFINFEASMSGKWLELLKEAVPSLKRAAFVFNPDTAPGHGNYFSPAFEAAANMLNVEPTVAAVHKPADIEKVVADVAKEVGGGIVISTDSFMTVNRKSVISSAERLKVPVIFPLGVFAKNGALLAYGPDYHDLFRRSAIYVDRILRGVSPAELPVQVPTKFELVINLQVAKAIGLTVPPTLLARADEVIE